jgi:hypothetical protein
VLFTDRKTRLSKEGPIAELGVGDGADDGQQVHVGLSNAARFAIHHTNTKNTLYKCIACNRYQVQQTYIRLEGERDNAKATQNKHTLVIQVPELLLVTNPALSAFLVVLLPSAEIPSAL